MLDGVEKIKFQKVAFTLAEVLITLGIVGVIAALTIPALINKYQKQETVTRYKKIYSEIFQALKLAEVENGTIENWDFTNSTNKTQDFADNFLYKHMKIQKKCDFSESGCWKRPVSLSNTASTNITSTRLSAITESGASLLFWVSASGGSSFIYTDIDGPNRGPAKLGVDVFVQTIFFSSAGVKAEYTAYGLSSPGRTREEIIDASTAGCRKNYVNSMAGAYCGALIQLDGWQIMDDYPW